jgi:hypothetical protein
MKPKKRKEDFSLLTASIVEMFPQTLAAHNFYKDMILDGIQAKMAATEVRKQPHPRRQRRHQKARRRQRLLEHLRQHRHRRWHRQRRRPRHR